MRVPAVAPPLAVAVDVSAPAVDHLAAQIARIGDHSATSVWAEVETREHTGKLFEIKLLPTLCFFHQNCAESPLFRKILCLKHKNVCASLD